MAQAMRDWLSGWEDFRVEAVECHELDDERVLVFTSSSGHGKRAGWTSPRCEQESTDVLRIRGGKVTRLVTYGGRDRALADLGLEG
jgi:hypothetical protein